MRDEKKVYCDICNFCEPYGVMGFDGQAMRCNNDSSEYFGKEIGFFSCFDCYYGETNLPYERW